MADQLLGSFVWCELLTSDLSGAESFYKKVVGWTPVPFAPDGSYIVFNKANGDGAGGMMKLPDAAKQMGAPPHWMMYLGTPDADNTAMRVAQLGGRVLKQPEDIPNVGRFAVVMDPFGASFALLQPAMDGPPRGPIGAGDFSWFELYTPNPEGAWKFYSTLFGWEKTSAMDMGEMGVYQMFGRGDGIPRGGIMKPPPGAPAAWAPYAMVKDAKAAAATATANGGQIVNGPMEVPGGDWIAQGIDPQGAMFSVHSLNPAAQKAAPAPAKKAAPKKKAKPAAKKAKPAKKAVKKAPTSAKATVGKKAKPVKKSAKPAKKKTTKKKAAKKKAAKKPKKK
jgi:uncharacterized protein